jgi:hypothetical protein
MCVSVAMCDQDCGQRTFLFPILDRVHLVDTGTEVGRVASESNLEGGKESVHARQQGLGTEGENRQRQQENVGNAEGTHGVAVAETAGWPSKTMTRSAR